MKNFSLIFILVFILSGCIPKFRDNNIPNISLNYESIEANTKDMVYISFNSDVKIENYPRLDTIYCIFKENGKINSDDFLSSHTVNPKNEILLMGTKRNNFRKTKEYIKKQNNLYHYKLSALIIREETIIKDDKVYEKEVNSNKQLVQKLQNPKNKLTCSIIQTYPLTTIKRYISNPMIISSDDFINILQNK